MRMFQAKVEKGNASLRSCFSSYTPCKHHFQGAFNAIISILFAFVCLCIKYFLHILRLAKDGCNRPCGKKN